MFSSYDLDGKHHLLEVLDVEHSTYVTPAPDYFHLSGRLDRRGRYMHLVAHCLKCGYLLNETVGKNISLAMIGYGPEDGEPGYVESGWDGQRTLEDWLKVWVCG
jgi:hypothetical protein